MSIIDVPVYAKKRRKSLAERRTDELLQQLSTDVSPIFGFAFMVRTTREHHYRRLGSARVQHIPITLEDRFYSKDRVRLFRHYQIQLARVAAVNNESVLWLETGHQISDDIKDQVDNRILRTRIDPDTRQETVVGFMDLWT